MPPDFGFERSDLLDLFRGFPFPKKPVVRILVVVDPAVHLTASDNFGIARVVKLIRAGTPYASFEVTLAVRPASTADTHADHGPIDPATSPETARYTGFRFNGHKSDGTDVLAGVDEVWCFGFDPGNDGSTDDSHVTSAASAATDAELLVLAAWMNAGGSVLAIGDHHYLGASLCSRMLRVGTMRRWTNADGVPPIGGFGMPNTQDRIDTNQPMNLAQRPTSMGGSGAVIPFGAQSDAVPQPLEVRYFQKSKWGSPFATRKPHPILCGGKAGIVNVFPDHPHEGRVREDAEVPTTSYWVVDGATPEYPHVGVVHPKPTVIAWGHTTASPPYNHDKGPEQALRFPVLGVYDGESVHAGRIVVDSTWHHWFDVNLVGVNGLVGFEGAADQTTWKKLVAFYQNVAVWLARPAKRAAMLSYVAFWTAFNPSLCEELRPASDAGVIGKTALSVLGHVIPDCTLRDWIGPVIREYLVDRVLDGDSPWPCLTCPPIDMIEERVFGELLKEHLPIREAIDAARHQRKTNASLPKLDPQRAIRRAGAAVGADYAAWLEKEHAALTATLAHVVSVAKAHKAAV